MKPGTGNLKEIIEKAGLKSPKCLILMITDACNLSCPHCLLNCRSLETAPLSEDIILNIIDDFIELEGESFIVTGGEPLLHPDWFNILGHACNSTALLEVILQTNGSLITGEVIKKLKLLNSDKLKIQLSIDGATPETNDCIRGRGNFEASVMAIKKIADAGMGKNIKIAFTEMRHNFHELPGMLRLADDLGIGQFISGALVKAGRAKNAGWIKLPDAVQIRVLIERYESDPVFRGLYDKLGNISAIEWYKGRNVPIDHVCNCIMTPFINAQGKMFPCVMNLDKDLAVENVHEEGFNDVILKGIEKWSRLPMLDMRRSESLAKCHDCKGREHCRGGCIGRAQTVNGDSMSVEDRCELRREVYYLEKNHER